MLTIQEIEERRLELVHSLNSFSADIASSTYSINSYLEPLLDFNIKEEQKEAVKRALRETKIAIQAIRSLRDGIRRGVKEAQTLVADDRQTESCEILERFFVKAEQQCKKIGFPEFRLELHLPREIIAETVDPFLEAFEKIKNLLAEGPSVYHKRG